jgi:hypothetical protein
VRQASPPQVPSQALALRQQQVALPLRGALVLQQQRAQPASAQLELAVAQREAQASSAQLSQPLL